jgi:hypothetical protein
MNGVDKLKALFDELGIKYDTDRYFVNGEEVKTIIIKADNSETHFDFFNNKFHCVTIG